MKRLLLTSLVVALLLAMPGYAQSTLSQPSPTFPVEAGHWFLTGERGSAGATDSVLLLGTQPVAGEANSVWIPVLAPLGVTTDHEEWYKAQAWDHDRLVIGSTNVALYYSLQVNAVADITVSLLAKAPGGHAELLGTQTETVSADSLLPHRVDVALATHGAILPADHVPFLRVEVSAASVLFNLQYGSESAPSAITRLATQVLDSDHDGLGDTVERDVTGTDPFNPDTDGDGVSDGNEVLGGSDPLDPNDQPVPGGIVDSDHDGLPDAFEEQLGTDPFNPDTDGDGYSDGLEFHFGSDPLDPASTPLDRDGDGLPDAAEEAAGTDPDNPDSDGDGVSDCDEDSDGDGLTNCEEAEHGTDPGNPDSDGDGTSDGDEVARGDDPRSPAPDRGGLGIEPWVGGGMALASGGIIAFALLGRYAL